jgi:transposase
MLFNGVFRFTFPMKDIQLYQQILGLEAPWQVETVTLNREAREIEVRVACTEKVWGCPTCAQRMHVHDYEERRWRHLDSCQFQTVIVSRVPVVKCPEHGAQTVTVPWAEKWARFSRLFERLAIDLMQECSISAACEILGISWDEADGIKARAVERGLARKVRQVPEEVCVDEKSAGHGQNYVTVVARVEAGKPATVDYVADGRSQESLDGYWEQWTSQELAAVQAVGMDMCEPYFQSTLAHVPEAERKIVYDRFHLSCHMNKAVNEVRKAETRELLAAGDTRLQGTRNLWLYGWENLLEPLASRFNELRDLKLKTGRAWAIKETWRDMWASFNRQEAEDYFHCWYSWAIRSRLAPVKRVARMFKRHLANILTYFDTLLSNGPIEGLNNRIQGLIKKAFGYRNRERFKTDILFHLGGLDLYPSQ